MVDDGAVQDSAEPPGRIGAGRGQGAVRVSVVEPGLIRTSFADAAVGSMGSEDGPYAGFDEAVARTTTENYTAIFRCNTGAPVVRLSAASMMALASMPWWR